MIDIHSHILPYTDDGATSWEHTFNMLRQAHEDGIKAVVATPHILSSADFNFGDEIVDRFRELKQRLKEAELDMRAYLGCEIYMQPDLKLDHAIATINANGRYYLVEFPMGSIPKYANDIVFESIINNRVPILAHPERNLGIQRSPSQAFDFVNRGVLMQINAGSILGRFGETARRLSHKLIQHNLVHLVGSDAHDTKKRPLKLKSAFEIISEVYGLDVAKTFFYENPLRVLRGEEIGIPEPLSLEDDDRKGILSASVGLLRKFIGVPE